MGKKKGTKRGSLLVQGFPDLSQAEVEVLHYLNEENLSPRQISIRRGTTIRAVYKIRKKLMKKGLISKKYKRFTLPQCYLKSEPHLKHGIRLHGVEFNIRIIYMKRCQYDSLRKKSNMVMVDGNTVRLYRDSLEVYINKSFLEKNVQEATSKCFLYANVLFQKIENELNIIILKDRKQNIRLVKAEYSEINNELAEDCYDKHEKIRIPAIEDGRVWFEIDNSFNLHEAETKHPETSKGDMEVVKAFFNDVRKYPSIPSDMALLLQELIVHWGKQQDEVSKQILVLVQSQKATTKVLDTFMKVVHPKAFDKGEGVKKEKVDVKLDYVG